VRQRTTGCPFLDNPRALTQKAEQTTCNSITRLRQELPGQESRKTAGIYTHRGFGFFVIDIVVFEVLGYIWGGASVHKASNSRFAQQVSCSPGSLPAESQQTTESCQLTTKWPSLKAKAGIADIKRVLTQ